ncbi:hypothetical protein PR048_015880 [Dryococelus australis]|uniref:Uncharacterized protein n=1 Tax=Dryococelus australis TaxID=614101 RepID=A0ABQ9HI68_9NEOP|nr:hypothetical protein PR048_015880 [Dryococelus australis]
MDFNVSLKKYEVAYPQVNKIASFTKKVFLKAPYRVLHYRELLPNVALRPEPVLTRWSTGLEAVSFYSEHFQGIKSVVKLFPGELAVSVREVQIEFNEPKIECAMAYIQNNFSFIAASIRKLETVGLSLRIVFDVVEECKGKLSDVRGDIRPKVLNEFEAVLAINPGYKIVVSIFKNLVGEEENFPVDISPGKYHLLKFAPATSCGVERSFSAFKNITSDRRLSRPQKI